MRGCRMRFKTLPNGTSHEIRSKNRETRGMKLRWGSYTKVGRIPLILHLIIAPKQCIECVIVHELCHLQAG